MVPGVVAMALFFTASAVGPLVTPWERQARTYERLVTSPASLGAILAGDAGAGAAFGAMLALLPLAGGLVLTSAAVVDPIALIAGWLLGALAFATLGVLLAAPATDTPSQVMMLSNSVAAADLHQRCVRAARSDAGMGPVVVATVAAVLLRGSHAGGLRRGAALVGGHGRRSADGLHTGVRMVGVAAAPADASAVASRPLETLPRPVGRGSVGALTRSRSH